MNNAFNEASKVEDAGLKVLIPYLKSRAKDGQVVTTDKGRLSRKFQKKYGDALLNNPDGEMVSVEFKIEKSHTGNLFIETWSNLDFDRRNRGWIDHLDTDYILYYFISTDDLYYLDFRKLWEWAFKDGKIYEYRLVRQMKYSQLNDTRGRIVPIKALKDARVIVGTLHPKSELKTMAVLPFNNPLKRA